MGSELPVSLPDALHMLITDRKIRGRLPASVKEHIEAAYRKEAEARICRDAVFEAQEAEKGFDKRAKRAEIDLALTGPPDAWHETFFEFDRPFLIARSQAYRAAAELARRELAEAVDYGQVFDQLAATWSKHVEFPWDDTWTVAKLKERRAEAARLRPLILRINQVVADAVFGDIPDGGTLALRKTDSLLDARSLFIHAQAPVEVGA